MLSILPAGVGDYIVLPLVTDPDDLATVAFDYLTTQIPGWAPSPADPVSRLIEAEAQMIAEETDVAANVSPAIFRYLGQLHNLPPQDAVPASVSSTWTMIDTQGYTIPQGTVVQIAASGNQAYAFANPADIVIPAGQAQATGVVLVAVDPGAGANGLGPAATLVDAYAFVGTIVLAGTTGGGVDAEQDDAYVSRLSATLRLITPTPILPGEFAALYRTVPGVFRAVAIDLYNPVDGTTNNPRMVTVAGIDTNGNAASPATKAAGLALLQALREVNFIVNVIDASYTPIDVAFTAQTYPGYDPVAASAAAVSAVQNYLNPATWGLPPSGETPLWLPTPKVRVNKVIQAVEDAPGIAWAEPVVIGPANLVPNPSFETDLSGWATSGVALNAGATISRTTAQAYVGAASTQLNTTAAVAYEGAQISLPGRFRAGAPYTFSVSLKGNAGGEGLQLLIGDAYTGSNIGSSTVNLTNAWQQFTLTWTPSADRTAVYIAIRSVVAVAETVFVDGVMVTQTPAAVAYGGDISDITLSGPAALPRAGTITPTVTAG